LKKALGREWSYAAIIATDPNSRKFFVREEEDATYFGVPN
jgi:hypothetical protein